MSEGKQFDSYVLHLPIVGCYSFSRSAILNSTMFSYAYKKFKQFAVLCVHLRKLSRKKCTDTFIPLLTALSPSTSYSVVCQVLTYCTCVHANIYHFPLSPNTQFRLTKQHLLETRIIKDLYILSSVYLEGTDDMSRSKVSFVQ